MRRERPAAVRGLAAALAIAGVASCGSDAATTLVVEVYTDLTPGVDLDTVRIVAKVGAVEKLSVPIAVGAGAGAQTLPLRLALVPRGSDGKQIEVQAAALRGSTLVVSQEAIVSFSPGEARTLKLFLGRKCVGRICDPTRETCWAGDGSCQSKVQMDLPRFAPGQALIPPRLEPLDAGSDAGDAPVDPASEAAPEGPEASGGLDGTDGVGAERGDVAPEGPVCVAVTEDCFNSKDDDCDGKTDCSDTDCNPTAECVTVVGGGAVGVAGNRAPTPAMCPAGSGTPTSLGGGLTATGCTGCTCSIMSVMCSTQVFYYATAAECAADSSGTAGALWMQWDSTKGCSPMPIYDATEGVRVTAFIPSGSCSNNGVTATKGTPTWSQQTAFCPGDRVGGGCGADQVCAKRTQSACVLIPGAAACPAGTAKATPSAAETTWHTGFTDGRTCGTCTCSLDCSSMVVHVGNDWSCTAGARDLTSGTRGCFSQYAPPVEFRGTPRCNASSALSGTLAPTGDQTLCCKP